MKKQPILEIQNLSVSIEGKSILSEFNLHIYPGEVHAIMGPNGSGKTTLANVLARHHSYQITSGHIQFSGKNLLKMSPEQCAQNGMFLSFQQPVSIPGVSNIQFLKASLNAIRKAKGLPQLDALDILKLVKKKMKNLGIAENMLQRSVNDGFSGGEKKRNEILQMSLLEPTLAVLDETDSGLDIDALITVSNAINAFRNPSRAILMITHYQKLLTHIEPDFVHVLTGGNFVHSGDKNLPLELEDKGYTWLKKNVESN